MSETALRRSVRTCKTEAYEKEYAPLLDDRDRRILGLLQVDAEMSVTEIAERVSLSVSACSRRIAALRSNGFVVGSVAVLDRRKINLPTTISVLVKTSRHSQEWLDGFRAAVAAIPEIVEVHRLTGTVDYILKLVLPDVEHYDTIYKRLIARTETHDMSAFISMETIKLSSTLPISYV